MVDTIFRSWRRCLEEGCASDKFAGRKFAGRKEIYTGAVGIFAIIFMLAAGLGELDGPLSAVLILAGLLVYAASIRRLVLDYQNHSRSRRLPGSLQAKLSGQGGRVTQLFLLNEEGGRIRAWNLEGETGMSIGKGMGGHNENDVDIDLSGSPNAATVAGFHAVLNYAGGSWFVENLGPQGSALLRRGGREYRLAAGEPLQLRQEDILQLGLCRLLAA